MNIPSFDKFYRTIGPDQMAEFFGGEELIVYQINGMSPENIGEALKKLHFDTTIRSANFSIALLRAYHNWLSKQLGQSLWDPQ